MNRDLSILQHEAYHEDQKFIDGGISYPFRTHIEIAEGRFKIASPHYHNYIEIIYGLSGAFEIFIDGHKFTFGEGDLVLVNAMEVHAINSLTGADSTYIVIRFEPEMLYTTAQTIFEAKYVLPFTMRTSEHQKVFSYEEIKDTPIPGMLERIIDEDRERRYGFELAIRTDIGSIFLWILRYWHDQGLDLKLGVASDQTTIERLQLVFDYVDSHYDEALTLDLMADMCGMSYSYFSRFFKKAMNRNFSDYVNFVRVSKAEELLTSTDLSITEVGSKTGFSTTSYFIEQFKSFKDMTPRKFREIFK